MKKLALVLGLAGVVAVPAFVGHNAYALDAKGVSNHARDILNRARVIHAEAYAEAVEARKTEELAARGWRQAASTFKQSAAIELDAALILGDDKEHKAAMACIKSHTLSHKAAQLDARAFRAGEAANAAAKDEAWERQEIAAVQKHLSTETDPAVKARLQEALKDFEKAAARDAQDVTRDRAEEKRWLAEARRDVSEAEHLKSEANTLVPNSCK